MIRPLSLDDNRVDQFITSAIFDVLQGSIFDSRHCQVFFVFTSKWPVGPGESMDSPKLAWDGVVLRAFLASADDSCFSLMDWSRRTGNVSGFRRI